MWSPADIADAVADGLRRRAAALDAEHAVYGLDALDEVQLHPFIAEALSHDGYGVYREQRYPADLRRRRESEGERCDFVLTPAGQPLRAAESKATLFEPEDAIDLDEAFWLETKVVAQYTPEGPNRQYASQFLSTVRHDVTKLAKDPGIFHAGLLIVLFVRDETVAKHDLDIWQDRCLQRMLPIAAPSIRHVPISDRMGHSLCTVALYPVRRL